MALSARFQNLAADAKTRIREVSAKEAGDQQKEGALIDVREAEEFAKEHATGAGLDIVLQTQNGYPERCQG